MLTRKFTCETASGLVLKAAQHRQCLFWTVMGVGRGAGTSLDRAPCGRHLKVRPGNEMGGGIGKAEDREAREVGWGYSTSKVPE